MRVINQNKWFLFDQPQTLNVKYVIKRALLPIFDIIYKLAIHFARPKNSVQKKYNLSICCIFKDEGLSLKEWIEFHKLVGVDHFYMYNNFSTDNYIEILTPYIEADLVTLIEWPVERGQFPAYHHFLDNLKNETQWVSFLDLDEYICPKKEINLKKWLQKYINKPSVLMYWKIFGTSGRIEHDDSMLITEQYTHCADKYADVGKYFLNTDWSVHKASFSMHHIDIEASFLGKKILVPIANEFGKYFRWSFQRIPRRKEMTIQVNHYITKSYNQTVINKFQRGDAVFGNNGRTRTVEVFFINEHLCTTVDYTIYRFMIELKLAMGKDTKNDSIR